MLHWKLATIWPQTGRRTGSDTDDTHGTESEVGKSDAGVADELTLEVAELGTVGGANEPPLLQRLLDLNPRGFSVCYKESLAKTDGNHREAY